MSKTSAQAVTVSLRPGFQPPSLQSWIQLCAKLVEMTRKPSQEPDNDGETPIDFIKARAALAYVLEYLSNTHGLIEERALHPLGALAEALQELSDGRKPALLALKPVPHNPGTRRRKAHMIGLAARCMDDLIKGKVNRTEAAKQVVRALDKGRAVDHASTKWSTVAKWRDLCNAGPGSGIALEAIKKFKDPVVLGCGQEGPERAQIILKILSDASNRLLGD